MLELFVSRRLLPAAGTSLAVRDLGRAPPCDIGRATEGSKGVVEVATVGDRGGELLALFDAVVLAIV